VDAVAARGQMDVMQELAGPLPAIVTAELLGVPTADHEQLKDWSQDFAEMLGNFQHNPGRVEKVLRSVEGMTSYFRDALTRQSTAPTEGLLNALANAEVDGRPADRGRGDCQRRRDHGGWPGDDDKPDW